MIYVPDTTTPDLSASGLPRAEPVELKTDDGLVLGAWFVPAEAATGVTAIVFNGNAGHREYRAGLAQAFARRGISVLLFDYRGYGGNPGSPSETGLAADARAALKFLESRPGIDPRRIVYFGESLGAAVAVGLASVRPPGALVLRSPFSSLRAMAAFHFGLAAIGGLLRDKYESIQQIGLVRMPLLMIAGGRDRVVPLEDSRHLFEAAHEPKQLIVLPGADHNDLELCEGDAMMDAIAGWLRDRLP